MSILMLDYSEKETEVADAIAEVLRAMGIDCIQGARGTDWDEAAKEEFDSMLMDCLSYIPVVSAESSKSGWLPYEVGYARGREKHVVCYVTSPSLDVPAFLSGLELLRSMDDLCRHLASCDYAEMLRRLSSEQP
jgi:hypothetical protein